MSEITKETVEQIVKRIDENVHEIKAQTTKTNGRVSCLENWKNKVTGALIIMNIILIHLLWIYIKSSF